MHQQMMGKNAAYYLKTVVMLVIMFGFRWIPPMEPLTEMGMNLVGIFIGIMFGWCFIDILWPSLMGLIAFGLSGYYDTVGQAFSAAFSNETTLFCLFILIFMAIVSDSKITDLVLQWFVSRKFIKGRPWVLIAVILIATFLMAGLINMFAAMFISWGMVYTICEKCGYDKKGKFCTTMILAIAYVTCFGSVIFPFKAMPLIMLGQYKAMTGIEIDFTEYFIMAVVLGICSIVGVLFFYKYLLKLDVSKINTDLVLSEKMAITAYQKKVAMLLCGLMVCLFLPSFLPKSSAIYVLLNKMGLVGTTVLFIIVGCVIKTDDKPLFNFGEMAKKGIPWDTMMLCFFVMPFSSALTGEGTGIKEFVVQVLSPILMGKSAFLFAAICVIAAIVLTNLLNNLVTGFIIMALMCSIAPAIGANSATIAVLISLTLACALITPGASPVAALVHGNKEWIETKTAAKYATLLCMLSCLFTVVIGIPLGNLLLAHYF